MDMTAKRAEIEAANEEVRDYVLDLVARRRQQPGEDLVSALAYHEQAGDRLSDDEIVTLAGSVIAGGTDTTESQLAHGLRLFADHPGQWDRLGDDPALAEQACQEVLRFEPIVPFTARLVREELELAGIVFPVGTVIFVCAATANRDSLTYADPGRFDIMADRGGAQVVTFGFGAHFCAGASLARAEIIEALAFLAPRMRHLEPDGEPVFGTPTGIYAMRSLPVRFTPHEPGSAATADPPPGWHHQLTGNPGAHALHGNALPCRRSPWSIFRLMLPTGGCARILA